MVKDGFLGKRLMYEEHFELGRRPFSSVPRSDRYCPTAAIEAARQTLIRCVERAEGVGVVIGPTGTGKTLLCQLLAAHLKGLFKVAVLPSGRLGSPRTLFQAVLFELGQTYREMDEGELRLALANYLTRSNDCPNGIVLIVDEAHSLSSRLLEEIRIVANLASDGRPCVRPVLVGGPMLEERLASPKLDAFNQRIVARCYLEPLNRSETCEYVQGQLQAAGGNPDALFSVEACQAVYQATDGIPRLINQLCDHALVLAYAAGRRAIDRARVEEAWADLQQLPMPSSVGESQGSESGVIEFGGLDDDTDENPLPGDEAPATISIHDATSDPAEQVTQIQETLGQLDDEFQPAGSIKPEIELVFSPADDPFDEEFQEEEVIVDRVAPATAAAAPRAEPAPAVAFDGDALEEPAPAVAFEGDALEEPAVDPTPALEIIPLASAMVPLSEPEPLCEPDLSCEPEPIATIVVEEHEDAAKASVPLPSSPPRQEYRRLFTALRANG